MSRPSERYRGAVYAAHLSVATGAVGIVNFSEAVDRLLVRVSAAATFRWAHDPTGAATTLGLGIVAANPATGIRGSGHRKVTANETCVLEVAGGAKRWLFTHTDAGTLTFFIEAGHTDPEP